MKAACNGWGFSGVPSPSSVTMLPFPTATRQTPCNVVTIVIDNPRSNPEFTDSERQWMNEFVRDGEPEAFGKSFLRTFIFQVPIARARRSTVAVVVHADLQAGATTCCKRRATDRSILLADGPPAEGDECTHVNCTIRSTVSLYSETVLLIGLENDQAIAPIRNIPVGHAGG